MPDDLAAGIVESAPDAILVVDGAGTIVAANRHTEELFGHPRDDLVGAPVETLLPLASRVAHIDHRLRYLDAPRSRPMGMGMTLRGLHRDGREFPVEIALSPFETADGMRVIASVRDVTERERIERELRAAAEDLAATVERERIARDLHDTVIQHLFAVGVTLQVVEQHLEDPEQLERVRWVTAHLDGIIDEVRHAIFGPVTSYEALGGTAPPRDRPSER